MFPPVWILIIFLQLCKIKSPIEYFWDELDACKPLKAPSLHMEYKVEAVARKCSYRKLLKSLVLWTFPGFGYELTSSNIPSCSEVATKSPIDDDVSFSIGSPFN